MTIDENEIVEIGPEANPTKVWFIFSILYLFMDYVRPQDTIKILGYVRPAMFITIILAIFIIRNKNIINWKPPQLRLIWYFIALLAVLIPFSFNHHFAYNAALQMLLYMTFIISSICCINSIERLKKLFFFALLFMAYQAQFAIRHHGTGTGSQFGDENDFAFYINMWLPFCVSFILSEKNIWKKIMFGSFAGLGIGANVIGRSRGGFTGLAAMFLVFWIFNPKKIISLLILAIVGCSLYFFAGDKYWSRIATASDTQHGTAKARLESWKAGWNMFLHNPQGVGGFNFEVRFSEYQSNYFQRDMYGRVAHSLWFTLLPETGVIGSLIYLFLFFINIRDIFRLRKNAKYCDGEDQFLFKHLSVAFLASIAGYCTSGTFISVLYYPHYWYLAGILTAITGFVNNMVSIKENEAANDVA